MVAFLEAVALGALFAAFYDLYRVVRMQFRRLPPVLSVAADCFFWIAAAAAAILFWFTAAGARSMFTSTSAGRWIYNLSP